MPGPSGAAIATLIALPIDLFGLVPSTSLVVIYMVTVMFIGARAMAAALATSVICFLTHNFFFTAPRYTFTIQRAEDVVGIVLFLLGALFTGTLAGRPEGAGDGDAREPAPHCDALRFRQARGRQIRSSTTCSTPAPTMSRRHSTAGR